MRKTHNDSTGPKKQEQVELADIFRLYADDYRRSHALSYEQLKVMHHTLTGLPYQTTASSPLITAGLLLPTGIGKKTMKSKK